MRMPLGYRSGACFAAVVLAVWACNRDRDGFVPGPESPPPLSSDTDAGTPPVCNEGAVRCSRDFRSVVGACDDSKIVAICPPEEACSEGRCVPACDAAVSRSASVGCEFVAIPPPYFIDVRTACLAAFIANTWVTPVRLDADYAGKPIDVVRSGRIVRTTGQEVTYEPFDGELQPDEVLVLFLSHGTERSVMQCPAGIEPAVVADTTVHKTGRGSSFRIRTSAPVSAYSIYPFGGARSAASSATLLLPIASWKTEYVVANAWEVSQLFSTAPSTQIVAAEDATDVTILSKVPIQPGKGVDGAEAGVPHTYRLNRGELLQFVQNKELTGALISANKSVALWGGHECMNAPSSESYCDQSTRQLLPLQSWGREYVGVPHISRRLDGSPEEYYYRVMAAADDTVLAYEPRRPQDAPSVLSKGQSVRFTTFEPFVVRTQDDKHPIMLYEHMTGSGFDRNADQGDPEFSFVVPADQYLDSYVFFVDPTYTNSHLVVVRARPDNGDFQPVELDCAGPIQNWAPVGNEGRYEYARFYLTRGGSPQKIGSGTCGAGRHKIDSHGPFGVTVWGTDTAVSYSYAGGAALRKLNDVVSELR